MTFQLNVWLTACSPPNDVSQLHVSGMFFFMDQKPLIEAQLTQAIGTERWALQKDALVVRSPETGAVWSLPTLLRQGNYSTSHQRKYPGHISAVLSLNDVDAATLDFHLIVKDAFNMYCSFLPRTLEPMPWAGQSASQLAKAKNGVKQCSWLTEGQHIPRPSYVFVSPFFKVSATQFATMLKHHMDYHSKLGVDRYITYVEEGFEELAASPLVQNLTAAGKLRIAQWEELPHYGTASGRYIYAFQNLVYRHMMLATFHEDAVAALVDLDEYVMTPQKTTLEEVLRACGSSVSTATAALHVNRRAGWCSGCSAALQSGASKFRSVFDQLDRHMVEKAHPLEQGLWVNETLAKTMLVSVLRMGDPELPPPSHPIALYARSTYDYFPKSVVAVRHIATNNPHWSYAVPGMLQTAANDSCVYILHLRSQVELRLPNRNDGFKDERPVPRNFFWVLDELAAA